MIFTVPLHEFNHCHEPSGQSVGGQFCGEETASFREWFGNSKVVDANGNPLRMFHSTNVNHVEFLPGSHFGDAEAANQRAETLRSFSVDVVGRDPGLFQVKPVYLKIENPIRLPDLVTIDARGEPVDEKTGESTHPDFRPLSWEAEGDLVEALRATTHVFDNSDDFWEHQYDSTEEVISFLKTKGYDGFVYQNAVENPGHDSWVIFDPKQVRSAIGVRPMK